MIVVTILSEAAAHVYFLRPPPCAKDRCSAIDVSRVVIVDLEE